MNEKYFSVKFKIRTSTLIFYYQKIGHINHLREIGEKLKFQKPTRSYGS